jgi:hypothetical protein
LRKLAERDIDPKKVERAIDRIGAERLAQRDTLVASWEGLTLKQRDATPCGDVPDLAVAMMDGGRMQIRPDQAPEEEDDLLGPAAGPAEGGAAAAPAAPADPTEGADPTEPARRKRCWREDKVGVLLHMKSEVHQADPCPELPEVFRDPLVTLKLAREVGHVDALPDPGTFRKAAEPEGAEAATAAEGEGPARQQATRRPGCPEVERRQVLASRQKGSLFGPLLAATAWSLGLMAAKRRAFVGDGAALNWAVQQRWFARFEPIVDFIHVLSYVFAAAMAGRPFAEGWPAYQEWISWVWKGEVKETLAAMRRRLGELAEGTAAHEVVSQSLAYLEGQAARMDYGRYRKEGLPIMSSIIESTVKQVGRRVKGTEKFWSEEGAEAVLQLRADYLSDGEPMERFWEERSRRMTGQRAYRRRAG